MQTAEAQTSRPVLGGAVWGIVLNAIIPVLLYSFILRRRRSFLTARMMTGVEISCTRNSTSLGTAFRPGDRRIIAGKFFVNFSPGVSNAATKAIREEIRGWQLRCRIDRWIVDLARLFNPIIRGWITYYGRYYKSALYPALRYLDRGLAAWAMAKYKRLRRHRRRAEQWVRKTALRDPRLFAHWPLLHHAPTGR